MISNNVARHKESFCVECNAKTDGGRYCDSCLPPNQTELEEQADRGTATRAVPCPRCHAELSPRDEDDTLRRAVYRHLAKHRAQFSNHREMLALLDQLAPDNAPDLEQESVKWDGQLADIGKEIVRQSQEGAAEKESTEPAERIATTASSEGSKEPTVPCPFPGCAWVSSPGEPSRLKQRLNDHLNTNVLHRSLSREERLMHVNQVFPGVSWPRTAVDRKQEATGESRQPAQERAIRCPCGSVLTARSPKTKLETLVSVHVDGHFHKNLNQAQKHELKTKLMPSHRWRVPEGYGASKGESRSTPDAVHRASPAAARVPAS